MHENLRHQFLRPDKSISDFVYGFSMAENMNMVQDAVLIPNGRIDLFLVKETNNKFSISLMGLETQSKPMPQNNYAIMFGIINRLVK